MSGTAIEFGEYKHKQSLATSETKPTPSQPFFIHDLRQHHHLIKHVTAINETTSDQITFVCCSFSIAAIQQLLMAIKCNSHIKKLSFVRCEFFELSDSYINVLTNRFIDSGYLLAESLLSNPSITHLALEAKDEAKESDTGLSSRCITKLSNVLKSSSIRDFKLTLHQWSDETDELSILLGGITKNTKLEKLEVGNARLTLNGAKNLCRVLQQNTLTELRLPSLSIRHAATGGDYTQIIQLLCSGFKAATRLQHLNLSQFSIDFCYKSGRKIRRISGSGGEKYIAILLESFAQTRLNHICISSMHDNHAQTKANAIMAMTAKNRMTSSMLTLLSGALTRNSESVVSQFVSDPLFDRNLIGIIALLLNDNETREQLSEIRRPITHTVLFRNPSQTDEEPEERSPTIASMPRAQTI